MLFWLLFKSWFRWLAWSFVETWDETKPAGTRDLSLGDDDIREFKRGIRERLAVDHVFEDDEAGFTTIGYHNKCTLVEQSSDPSVVTDAGILYTKDDGSGNTDLYFRMASPATILRLVKAGALAVPSGIICAWSGTIATVPTGWVFCNGSSSTPDMRDRFIIGARSDDAGVAKTQVTGSLTQSGGAATVDVSHTHTGDAHDHGGSLTHVTSGHGSQGGQWEEISNAGDGTVVPTSGYIHSIPSDSDTTGSGGSATQSILPPYYALAFVMKS